MEHDVSYKILHEAAMSTSSSNINIVSMVRGTLMDMVTLQFDLTYTKGPFTRASTFASAGAFASI